MDIKTIFDTALTVLQDGRVIGTAVAMLLVINFAVFVANYVHKDPPPRVKHVKKTAPTPAPTPTESEGGGDGDSAKK